MSFAILLRGLALRWLARHRVRSALGGLAVALGVAAFPNDSLERHELIELADQALYYCKEHGRNRVTKVSELP